MSNSLLREYMMLIEDEVDMKQLRLQKIQSEKERIQNSIREISNLRMPDENKENIIYHFKTELEELEKEENSLKVYFSIDINKLEYAFENIKILKKWYEGWLMWEGANVEIVSKILHGIKDVFPIEKSMLLYRVASYAEKQPAKYARVSAGPKVIQSWTLSKEKAIQFYETQKLNPERLTKRPGKRYYALLKAIIPADKILITPYTMDDFLETAYQHGGVDYDAIEKILSYRWQEEVIIESDVPVAAKIEWLN